MIEDAELLRRYAEEKSEAAFAELVQRHVNFVYAGALRRVGGDAHLAEDVTQQVFVAVAGKAAALARHPALSGWLFTATRNVAAQLVRTERRRQRRESEASIMNELTSPSANEAGWERLRPVLDAALDRLGETDRQAVLLRFFEGKSFAEIGGRLRLAENTARVRVDRAVDKLKGALAARGVTSTTAALGLALASQAGVAAPAGLAATVTGAALAGSGAAAVGAAGGGLTAIFMSMTKLQVGIVGVLAVAGATDFASQAQTNAALRRELAGAQQEAEAGIALQAENIRLAQAAVAADAARMRGAELLRLRDEAVALRARLQAAAQARPSATDPGRTARLAPPFTGRAYNPSELDQKPKVAAQERPIYPAEMSQARVGGEAMVDFIVDTEGTVRNAVARSATHPAFASAAVKAVDRWRFDPGQKDGQTVATRMAVPVIFKVGPDDESAAGKGNTWPSVPWF